MKKFRLVLLIIIFVTQLIGAITAGSEGEMWVWVSSSIGWFFVTVFYFNTIN